MGKLISCAAVGVLLLAAGMAGAAPLRGGGGGAGLAAGVRGGGPPLGSGPVGGAPLSRSTTGMAPPSSVFQNTPGVVGPGRASPVYRGNAYAYQGRERGGERFRHRRFGPGFYAFGFYPDDYSDYSDYGYYANNGECGYVWVRRDGVRHRVYTCQYYQ